jgi:pimeloyl-ACP methyl ester carboxylesterase
MECRRLLAERRAPSAVEDAHSTRTERSCVMAADPKTQLIALASGLEADILVKGDGPPLLFLHPAQGRTWSPFLDGLAERYTVYAPLTPGSIEPDDLVSFDGFSDLALYYDDLMRALGIDQAVVVGHSFGGMAAAEFAAYYPDRVSALVLIGAQGLWIDETPVADIHTTHPSKLAGLLFMDPEGAAAKSVLGKPTPEDRLYYQLALGAATHFYWPIPDRDLKRRLYRIDAPTLLVWGSEDRVTPPVYADAFTAKIKGARKILIDGAGHFPHLEQPKEVLKAIESFASEGAAQPQAVSV